jgi:hypothetical protein
VRFIRLISFKPYLGVDRIACTRSHVRVPICTLHRRRDDCFCMLICLLVAVSATKTSVSSPNSDFYNHVLVLASYCFALFR